LGPGRVEQQERKIPVAGNQSKFLLERHLDSVSNFLFSTAREHIDAS
jgi:hypothetical protein